jgi:hypothetical protein
MLLFTGLVLFSAMHRFHCIFFFLFFFCFCFCFCRWRHRLAARRLHGPEATSSSVGARETVAAGGVWLHSAILWTLQHHHRHQRGKLLWQVRSIFFVCLFVFIVSVLLLVGKSARERTLSFQKVDSHGLIPLSIGSSGLLACFPSQT